MSSKLKDSFELQVARSVKTLSYASLSGLGLLIFIGGLSLLAWTVGDMIQAWRSNAWTPILGNWCYSETINLGHGMLYHVSGYEYLVNGISYTSTRDQFGGVMSRLHKTALWTNSLSVKVFYNPANPNESVLKPGLVFGHLVFVAAAILFLLCGISILRNIRER
jgi:hypothetical protein